MNDYTPTNPPRRGRAKRLWNALLAAGFELRELHYNPNCWGARHSATDNAWGQWAFTCGVLEYGLCGECEQGIWASGVHCGSPARIIARRPI